MKKLFEMSKPTEELLKNVYYHGCPDETKAKQIIEDGYLVGRNVESKAIAAPRKDYVYTSTDITYAAIYAGCWEFSGSSSKDREKNHYIFVCDVDDVDDMLVDEDVLGEIGLFMDHTGSSLEYYQKILKEKYPKLPEKYWHFLYTIYIQNATKNQRQKAKEYDIAYTYVIGKKMQKAISDSVMSELLSFLPHIAHKSNLLKLKVKGYYLVEGVKDNEKDLLDSTYIKVKSK